MLSFPNTLPITSAEAERSFSSMKRIKTCSRSTMSEDTCWKVILWSRSDHQATVEVDEIWWIVPQISLKSKWKTLPPTPPHFSHSFGPGTFALSSHTYNPLFEKILDPPLELGLNWEWEKEEWQNQRVRHVNYVVSPLIGSGPPCCGGGLSGLLSINYSLQILIFN